MVDSKISKLPNFVYAGFPKTGSATITEIFKRHPEIFTTRQKEINFFNSESKFQNGEKWFIDTYYATVNEQPIVADNSIGYGTGLSNLTAERIYSSLGKGTKFLFTLRDPVERAFSQYLMAKNKGQFETLSFKEAIVSAIAAAGEVDEAVLDEITRGSYHSNSEHLAIYRNRMYLWPSMYFRTISEYISKFGHDNVLVLFTHDLEHDLTGQMKRIFDFLGVNEIEVDNSERHNEATTLKYPWLRKMLNTVYRNKVIREGVVHRLSLTSRKRLRRWLLSWNYKKNERKERVSKEDREQLISFLRSDIEQLEQLLNADLSAWKS